MTFAEPWRASGIHRTAPMPGKRRSRPRQTQPAGRGDSREKELSASAERGNTSDVDPQIRQAVAEYLEPQLSEVTAVRAETFAGPLPHPEHLASYESVLPGAADRILQMAERQLQHRIQNESRVIESNIKLEARGQLFAFTIATIIICGGIYLIAEGKSAGGLTSVISAIVALVSVFIYGKHQKRREFANNTNRKTTRPAQPKPPISPT